jgi:hypothetical protein
MNISKDFSIDELFNNINNISDKIENDEINPVMRKEFEGVFFFNDSREEYSYIICNFIEYKINLFNEKNFIKIIADE